MSGIETVYERGQGAYQFDTYYDNLCALQSSVPLTTVKAYLDRNILQINADKIRLVLQITIPSNSTHYHFNYFDNII